MLRPADVADAVLFVATRPRSRPSSTGCVWARRKSQPQMNAMNADHHGSEELPLNYSRESHDDSCHQSSIRVYPVFICGR